MRAAPAVPGWSATRNEANRGPRSSAITCGVSPTWMAWRASVDGVAGSTASSASASKRISRRDPSCATVCGVGGATSSVTRVRLPIGSTCAATRGIRMSPTRIRREGLRSSRRDPKIGASARADEIDGDVPGPAVTYRRGRQRDHPARDGGQRLLRRQDDRLTVDGHRQPASRRFFTHREIEQPRQIVEREHLLAADRAGGQRPARVARQHGIWKSRRGRLIGRQSRGQQRQPE